MLELVKGNMMVNRSTCIDDDDVKERLSGQE